MAFISKVAKFDPDEIVNEVDDMNLEDELQSCH